MNIKVKKIYYCDFCKKKKGLSASAMSLHEKHCTANPDRDCRACGRKKVDISIIEGHPYTKETVDSLNNALDGCPLCVLAVIRQGFTDQQKKESNFSYDLSSEMKRFWQEKLEKEQRDDEWSLTH